MNFGIFRMLSFLKPEQCPNYFATLDTFFQFLSGDLRKYIDYYLTMYKRDNVFPQFEIFLSDMGIPAPMDIQSTFDETTWDRFLLTLKNEQVETLQREMMSESLYEKKADVIHRLNDILISNQEHVVEPKSLKNISVGEIIESKMSVGDGLVHPIKFLNDTLGKIQKGSTMAIIAPTKNFKTTVTQNYVHQNSVIGDKRGLYMYAEDIEQNYQYGLFSIHSYFTGDKIGSQFLSQSLPDDKLFLEKLNLIKEKYNADAKGDVFYLPFTYFGTLMDSFSTNLKNFINKYKIDYVVLDHLYQLKSFAPPRMSWLDYLDLVSATMLNIAIGKSYGNDPVAVILLHQLTKESQKKADKFEKSPTALKFAAYSAAGIPSLENGCSFMLGLYASPGMKAAGQLQYQIILARRAEVSVSMQTTFVDPTYGFVGDVQELAHIYSEDSLKAIEDSFGGL